MCAHTCVCVCARAHTHTHTQSHPHTHTLFCSQFMHIVHMLYWTVRYYNQPRQQHACIEHSVTCTTMSLLSLQACHRQSYLRSPIPIQYQLWATLSHRNELKDIVNYLLLLSTFSVKYRHVQNRRHTHASLHSSVLRTHTHPRAHTHTHTRKTTSMTTHLTPTDTPPRTHPQTVIHPNYKSSHVSFGHQFLDPLHLHLGVESQFLLLIHLHHQVTQLLGVAALEGLHLLLEA